MQAGTPALGPAPGWYVEGEIARGNSCAALISAILHFRDGTAAAEQRRTRGLRPSRSAEDLPALAADVARARDRPTHLGTWSSSATSSICCAPSAGSRTKVAPRCRSRSGPGGRRRRRGTARSPRPPPRGPGTSSPRSFSVNRRLSWRRSCGESLPAAPRRRGAAPLHPREPRSALPPRRGDPRRHPRRPRRPGWGGAGEKRGNLPPPPNGDAPLRHPGPSVGHAKWDVWNFPSFGPDARASDYTDQDHLPAPDRRRQVVTTEMAVRLHPRDPPAPPRRAGVSSPASSTASTSSSSASRTCALLFRLVSTGRSTRSPASAPSLDRTQAHVLQAALADAVRTLGAVSFRDLDFYQAWLERQEQSSGPRARRTSCGPFGAPGPQPLSVADRPPDRAHPAKTGVRGPPAVLRPPGGSLPGGRSGDALRGLRTHPRPRARAAPRGRECRTSTSTPAPTARHLPRRRRGGLAGWQRHRSRVRLQRAGRRWARRRPSGCATSGRPSWRGRGAAPGPQSRAGSARLR